MLPRMLLGFRQETALSTSKSMIRKFYQIFILVDVCVHTQSVSRVPSLCNPLDCSPPDSSVHGILQARRLKWVVISFSRGSSQLSNCFQYLRIAFVKLFYTELLAVNSEWSHYHHSCLYTLYCLKKHFVLCRSKDIW